MICKNCGKEIPENSLVCPHCGCGLRKNSLNPKSTNDEQIPLVLIARQLSKHKVALIITAIIVLIAFFGYFGVKKYLEKKEAEEAFIAEVEHNMKIVGTYKSANLTLVLSFDNTALITYKQDGYRERASKGYWKDKFRTGLIEIEFSKALEDIYIGNEKRYYCSTLFLVGSTLWESMSAMKSQDWSACEFMEKNRKFELVHLD